MADEADIASSLIEGALSRAIDQLRKNSQNSTGTKTCTECGDDMLPERREMGFKLCITCAEETERRKALYGGYGGY